MPIPTLSGAFECGAGRWILGIVSLVLVLVPVDTFDGSEGTRVYGCCRYEGKDDEDGERLP